MNEPTNEYFKTEPLSLCSQMVKLSLPRPNDPLPTLPSHGTHWSVVQAGHAIVHSFHLYLDWAARVLVLIRNKL